MHFDRARTTGSTHSWCSGKSLCNVNNIELSQHFSHSFLVCCCCKHVAHVHSFCLSICLRSFKLSLDKRERAWWWLSVLIWSTLSFVCVHAPLVRLAWLVQQQELLML